MGQPIRLHTDEGISAAIIKGIRQRGVDVQTTPDAGLVGATDAEQLDRAHRDGRVLFTHDGDFLRMHATGVEHHGICFAPQGTSIGDVIRGLMLVYQVLDSDDMKGHVEFI